MQPQFIWLLKLSVVRHVWTYLKWCHNMRESMTAAFSSALIIVDDLLPGDNKKVAVVSHFLKCLIFSNFGNCQLFWKQRYDSVIWSGLTVWFLSFDPKTFSANQIIFFLIRITSKMIWSFSFIFLCEILETEFLVGEGFGDFLDVPLEVKLVQTVINKIEYNL